MNTTARNSLAAHSASSKVLRAIRLAVSTSNLCCYVKSGSPAGKSPDRRRVMRDLSLAREKVEQGGAK